MTSLKSEGGLEESYEAIPLAEPEAYLLN